MTATSAADGDSPPPATESAHGSAGHADPTPEPAKTAHPTGAAQAAENADNESPA